MSLVHTGFELVTKRTRKRGFLDEMNLVVPWTELVALSEPPAPAGKTGHPSFAVSTILCFHHLLEANNLSNQMLAIINATRATRGPMFKAGTVVDAALIAAPSFTKNSSGVHDPEMHQTKKGSRWHFGMKAPIGASMPTRAGCTASSAQRPTSIMSPKVIVCCTGRKTDVFADAGYHGAMKWSEATGGELACGPEAGQAQSTGQEPG